MGYSQDLFVVTGNLEVHSTQNDKWQTFRGATTTGICEDNYFIDLSFDKIVTNKIALTLTGTDTALSYIKEITLTGEDNTIIYHKIQPET